MPATCCRESSTRCAAEGLYRQGNFGEGRRDRLRAGRRADERGRGHEMERGDEALRNAAVTASNAVVTKNAVIARLDRATQYCRASTMDRSAPEYWTTRFRGW